MFSVVCPREMLFSNVQVVSRGVSGRSTRPVQNNIYLEAADNRLRLVATDLEFIGLEASLEASVRDSGAVTLPARLFTEAIGSLSAPQVELRADERNTVEVVGGTAQYSIRGLPAEDFEMLPDLLDPTTFSLSQVELSRVITQTVFATSTDDTRPNLTGALVQMCPEHLEVVATDTHRLAWRRVEVATGLEEPRSAIVSARALHELDRALEKDSQEPARLSFSDTQVQAVAAGITVGSRLIEGQFPSYQKVIPEQHERRVTLSGAAFLEALRRAFIVAREDANRVILRTAGNSMELTADSQDVGQVREELPIHLEGEDIEIAFNARYLMDVLNVVTAEEVHLDLAGPLNPGVLRIAGDPNYLYVLMPMQIL